MVTNGRGVALICTDDDLVVAVGCSVRVMVGVNVGVAVRVEVSVAVGEPVLEPVFVPVVPGNGVAVAKSTTRAGAGVSLVSNGRGSTVLYG